MSRSILALGLLSLALVAVQLNVFSELRLLGVVIMAVWLWAFCVGLVCSHGAALVASGIAGGYVDAHAATPFGLNALTCVGLAYLGSRLAREGVGDLHGAAIWMAPLLGGCVGLLTPLVFAIAATFVFDTAPWHGSLPASMVVNAIAFAVAARPLARLVEVATGESGSRR